MIETPCIRVCTLDPASGLCLGCGRTLDEIARWSSLSSAERAGIMQKLHRRLTDISLPKAREEMT